MTGKSFGRAAIVVALFLLTACGQTGELTLPGAPAQVPAGEVDQAADSEEDETEQ